MNRKKTCSGHFAKRGVLTDKANDLEKPMLENVIYYMCLEVQMGKQIFFFLQWIH